LGGFTYPSLSAVVVVVVGVEVGVGDSFDAVGIMIRPRVFSAGLAVFSGKGEVGVNLNIFSIRRVMPDNDRCRRWC
jgi:hypothetical protein